jgi:hypothetical protein
MEMIQGLSKPDSLSDIRQASQLPPPAQADMFLEMASLSKDELKNRAADLIGDVTTKVVLTSLGINNPLTQAAADALGVPEIISGAARNQMDLMDGIATGTANAVGDVAKGAVNAVGDIVKTPLKLFGL